MLAIEALIFASVFSCAFLSETLFYLARLYFSNIYQVIAVQQVQQVSHTLLQLWFL